MLDKNQVANKYDAMVARNNEDIKSKKADTMDMATLLSLVCDDQPENDDAEEPSDDEKGDDGSDSDSDSSCPTGMNPTFPIAHNLPFPPPPMQKQYPGPWLYTYTQYPHTAPFIYTQAASAPAALLGRQDQHLKTGTASGCRASHPGGPYPISYALCSYTLIPLYPAPLRNVSSMWIP